MATVKQTIGEHDVGRDESAAAEDSGRGTLEGPGATVGINQPSLRRPPERVWGRPSVGNR
jgi:hypothetical protein